MRHCSPASRGHEHRCVSVECLNCARLSGSHFLPLPVRPRLALPGPPIDPVAYPRSVVTHNGRRHMLALVCARASEGDQLAPSLPASVTKSGRAHTGEPSPSSLSVPVSVFALPDPVSWLASRGQRPQSRSRHHADAGRDDGAPGSCLIRCPPASFASSLAHDV